MGNCCCSALVLDTGSLPDGVELVPRSAVKIQRRVTETNLGAVLTSAFAGSATADPELGFDWCFGPELMKDRDNPMRQRMLGWIFRYVLEEAFAAGPRGAVLGCRNEDGTIGAVAVLKIYRNGGGAGAGEQMIAMARAGAPNRDTERYATSARMKAMEAALKKLHTAYAKGPHIYVWAVGVDPSAQGHGFCGKLLRAASAVADREQLPCYL